MPILIAISLFLLSVFVAWERRLTSRGATPLVSMKLFANGQFTAGASLTAAMSLGQIGLTFCIPVFLQSVRGLDALEEQIDECLTLAKNLDREGLANVISLLRRARNEVVWKMGER